MRGKLSVEMTRGDLEALDVIAAQTGFPREAAALYAVRLVAACIREGLLGDEMSAACAGDQRRGGRRARDRVSRAQAHARRGARQKSPPGMSV